MPAHTHHIAAAGLALLAFAADAGAQTAPGGSGLTIIVTPAGQIPWDGGGADIASTGDGYELSWLSFDGGGITYMSSPDAFEFGTTVGQPDAGLSSADCFELTGGFWAITVEPDCYANCDRSVTPPVLNVGDFTCFLQRYAAGDCYANCDQSTVTPVLNVGDFTCFLQKFAAGCGG